MNDIINFAKKKGCRKVKLSALFHVVGYYYKVLGFRFSKKNNRYSDEQMIEAAKQAAIIDSANDEVTFQELPRPLRTHMKGVYKQTGRVALNQEDYESLVEHQEYVLSNGIAMELDLSNFTVNINTENPVLFIEDSSINLNEINTNLDIRNIITDKESINNIEIKTNKK